MFIDTIVICSCTAFVILLGGVYVPGAEGIDGIALTQQSIVSHVGEWAKYYLTGAILLFAFSSIIYNYYLGENALTFMTKQPASLHILRIAIMGIIFSDGPRLHAYSSGEWSRFGFYVAGPQPDVNAYPDCDDIVRFSRGILTYSGPGTGFVGDDQQPYQLRPTCGRTQPTVWTFRKLERIAIRLNLLTC